MCGAEMVSSYPMGKGTSLKDRMVERDVRIVLGRRCTTGYEVRQSVFCRPRAKRVPREDSKFSWIVSENEPDLLVKIVLHPLR